MISSIDQFVLIGARIGLFRVSGGSGESMGFISNDRPFTAEKLGLAKLFSRAVERRIE
jgi:hypothetical protein